jgi:hypothetical protein
VPEKTISSSEIDLLVSTETVTSEDSSIEKSVDSASSNVEIPEVTTTEPVVQIPDVEEPEPARPQPKRLARKPGALPKKASKVVVSDENWVNNQFSEFS